MKTKIMFFIVVASMFILSKDVKCATEDEIKMIAQVTYLEAINQTEEGQKLVIDTILNRVDSEDFPNTISDVIKQPNQFAKIDSSTPCDLIELVRGELIERVDYSVLYFRTNKYHNFGTPVLKVGSHYFSSK